VRARVFIEDLDRVGEILVSQNPNRREVGLSWSTPAECLERPFTDLALDSLGVEQAGDEVRLRGGLERADFLHDPGAYLEMERTFIRGARALLREHVPGPSPRETGGAK